MPSATSRREVIGGVLEAEVVAGPPVAGAAAAGRRGRGACRADARYGHAHSQLDVGAQFGGLRP